MITLLDLMLCLTSMTMMLLACSFVSNHRPEELWPPKESEEWLAYQPNLEEQIEMLKFDIQRLQNELAKLESQQAEMVCKRTPYQQQSPNLEETIIVATVVDPSELPF